MRASSAVPAVFLPVRIGLREYVDGGLVSPVPVRFATDLPPNSVSANGTRVAAAAGSAAGRERVQLLIQAPARRSLWWTTTPSRPAAASATRADVYAGTLGTSSGRSMSRYFV